MCTSVNLMYTYARGTYIAKLLNWLNNGCTKQINQWLEFCGVKDQCTLHNLSDLSKINTRFATSLATYAKHNMHQCVYDYRQQDGHLADRRNRSLHEKRSTNYRYKHLRQSFATWGICAQLVATEQWNLILEITEYLECDRE